MHRRVVRLILQVAVVPILASPLWAADGVPSHTATWVFAGHGSLRVHFRAGDLKVVQGPDFQHITLRYTAEQFHRDASGRVKLRFDTEGPDAAIRMRAPNNVNLDAVLEVPGPLTLDVRMLAGDLTVERVEGNKSLQTHFGDITVIESKDAYPQLYRWIDASTRIGDVGARQVPFLHRRDTNE